MVKIMALLQDTSVIIVTYNHESFIENCLNSINTDFLDVIVVDNDSSDGTTDLIERKFPSVKLIRNRGNYGYGNGVNLGVKHSERKYLVILNPDVKMGENSIKELIVPLENREDIVTVPKALVYDGSKINTCGNIEHFTGLPFTRGLGEDIDSFNESMFINGLSGVCFAIKRDLYLKIGGFDESFFLYMEDVDLSWNIHVNKLKVLYIPSSVIYHDYKLIVPAEKIYYLEKGRYIILKKYFTWKQYLIILPSLLITEMFAMGYSILKGPKGIKFKLKAMKEGFQIEIKKKNCDTGKLLESLDWKIPEEQLSYSAADVVLKRFANVIYYLNFNIFKKLAKAM